MYDTHTIEYQNHTYLCHSAGVLQTADFAISAPDVPQAEPQRLGVTRIPQQWKNCRQVNRRYAHGVGRTGARDRTTGTPVTNFSRSATLYETAMRYNRGLDRDNDGIACEQV